MSKETMARSVELMFKSPSPSLTMELQGGEPSLVPDLIEYGIQLAEEINQKEQREITYVLCTNSIRLTDRMLDICKRYNVVISTSLDGPNFLHNANRGKKDSYEKVVAGIEKARTVLGPERVSALMTTSIEGLNYPVEIVDEYVKLGFRSMFLRALNPYGLAAHNDDWNNYTERFIEFYKTAFEHILDLNKHGRLFIEEFAQIILRKMLTPYCTGFVDLQSPAGVINSVLIYNYDGYVYASDESRMLAEFNDYTFQLGSVRDRYEDIVFGEKAKTIANVWANEALAGCSDCALKTYCGADPVRNYSTQGDMYGNRATSLLCKKNKAIIEYLISLIIERHDEVMPIFREWLS
jgi:His-Xaa-Ser system radical SAM maturase HxsB